MTRLYISARAWNQIERAVRKNPEVETGGIMMGYPLNEQDWLVTYASEPGPKAIHQPRSIFFDEPYLRNLVRKLNRRGAGRWRYIGDWHSHTVRRLSPSKGDRQTVYEKAVQAKYASTSPLMLIVGLGKRDQLNARAYILTDSLTEVKEIYLKERQARR
ncbi:Mov34/MPN/PAD-1 family protein [Brevibacillus fulvus]|uniref:Integrative and conjugative element protein (TIGR02256 family) n=1 Tax=Brevibacillus fulvus TaxID=1125967 RepID=A0A938XZY0_9BACL|nr:Mov34/MPN/PAD-1 family protein [Brevibacillus fulvus]MBM7589949.1 integrative and conjugative element protein (TIGR02256 family) [Brevibacillus fulvus]